LTPIFGSYSLIGTAPVTPDIISAIAANSLIFTNGTKPAYVIVAPSMIAYNQAYRVTPSNSFSILLSSLAHSRAWKLVVHRAGVVIYELPPTTVHLYSGPWKLPELKMPTPLPPLLTTASSQKARAHHKARRRRQQRSLVSPAPSSPQP
jgi:hypothetical protein